MTGAGMPLIFWRKLSMADAPAEAGSESQTARAEGIFEGEASSGTGMPVSPESASSRCRASAWCVRQRLTRSRASGSVTGMRIPFRQRLRTEASMSASLERRAPDMFRSSIAAFRRRPRRAASSAVVLERRPAFFGGRVFSSESRYLSRAGRRAAFPADGATPVRR